MNAAPLLQSVPADLFAANRVRHAFHRQDGGELLVLDDVNLTINQREIVSLLGRSGSGKSTLLRIICGLIRPSGGEVRFKGEVVRGPVQGIAMVFQNFALFPWLTVLENVQLGLEALRQPERLIRRRALEAIDLIGLDGFESAYPRELSGGMRQRVGFARALVVDPDILLMDEPFSALDVLTAETLRSDFFDLWNRAQAGAAGRPPRHPQHRRGGAAERPDPRPVVESRQDRGGNPGQVAPAAQPRQSGVPPARGRHLRADDRAPLEDHGHAYGGRQWRRQAADGRIGRAATGRVHQPDGRTD